MAITREIGKALNFINDTVTDITHRALSQGSVKYFDMFLTTPIENYCLIDMADFQKERHMLMNLMQKENLIYLMGDSTSGISGKVSDEVYDYDYSYTEGNNYLNEYQRYDAKETATRIGWRNDNIQNYGNGSRNRFDNHIYGGTLNMYPDDNDTGTGEFIDGYKWEFYGANNNPNSIIKKTKDFFRCRKINTIISRFHTDAYKLDLYDNTESATSAYGLSHGRNLLTYDAERNGISYDRNGYDNPYCRVWTHHHQYSQKRERLIRPLLGVGKNDKGNEVTNQQSLHKWKGFGDMPDGTTEQVGVDYIDFGDSSLQKTITKTYDKARKWGWKDNGANGWAMSVLDNKTGLLNIAPKYLGGAELNVHTRDCMFSIENLAWQGYDPYSFERALSWEQRGPFGGRIMWFPPYGLRFNEDTSVQWNEHSFIGRGENVYTYANTSRSGTLEFMMVVDHPSILDYATWHDNKPKDTDVLRFLAGCDSGDSKDGSSLLNYVKPTPLTDEYLQKYKQKEVIKITEEPTPQEPINETPDEPIELSFYVFYPNNYSGYYDNKSNSKVDPIAYLLCGNGAQWNCNTTNVKQSEVLPITFKDLSSTNEEFIGRGYEMYISGTYTEEQDEQNNFIIGTGPTRGYGKNTYIQNNDKRWYYRIDGEYVNGITYNEIKNCFGQTLTKKNSYKDMATHGLNWNIQTVKKYMDESDNDNLYTLAEVACALTNEENASIIKGNVGTLDEERINKLKEYFDKEGDYQVIEIRGVGYSNAHGSNSQSQTNIQRNEFLAIERCSTVFSWFKDNYGDVTEGTKEHEGGKNINKGEDESGKTAKMWRSAKITLKIKKNKTETQKDIEQKNNGKSIDYATYLKLSDEDKAKYEITQYKLKSTYVDLEGIMPSNFVTVEEYNDLSSSLQNEYIPCSYELKSTTEEQNEISDGRTATFSSFKAVEIKDGVQLYENTNETDPSKKGRRWVYNKEQQQMELWEKATKLGRWTNKDGWNSEKMNPELDTENANENTLRYDQEYHFFKKLSEKDPHVFNSLVDKLQYFDPAFHSMTPEGFMGRLNFLHQCTRQGDTVSASDENGHMANNLAFGRPPFCILRLGDFYYQKIVIRNINISYDPLVWDLNSEGIGVVPLIANVTISFNFIGGGDLSGPVRRLQNAMTENYYANSRLYNNRADRVERNIEWDTMQTSIDWANSYHHHVKMAE